MSFLPAYLDTSAIIKLIVSEPETEALRAALIGWPDRVSAALARVEVHRALWRVGASKAVRSRADAVLEGLVLIRIDDLILSRAASFKNPHLGALDAIHLAAALTVGDDPDVFVTYDIRLAEAATREGLRVQHPGISHLG